MKAAVFFWSRPTIGSFEFLDGGPKASTDLCFFTSGHKLNFVLATYSTARANLESLC